MKAINPMSSPIRALLVFMVFFATYVLSWVVLLMLPPRHHDWIASIVALVVALAVSRVCADLTARTRTFRVEKYRHKG
jgi:hypothetical protein